MELPSIWRALSLSSKLAASAKNSTIDTSCTDSSQSNLVVVVDDNLLVWSCEDCCFYAQHLMQDDAPIQVCELHLFLIFYIYLQRNISFLFMDNNKEHFLYINFIAIKVLVNLYFFLHWYI